MLRTFLVIGAALLALLPATARAEPATILSPDLTVDGSAFVLKLADGRVLRGQQMEGAIVHLMLAPGRVASVKLASIKPDPEAPDLLRHDLQVQDEKGEWKPLCIPNFYGETWGFPIQLPEGHPGRMGSITLACSADAVGKCVRFGYAPWRKGPKGEDLTPYHAACMHMVPADYCGDLKPHTRNGTSIDLYDDLGIQKPGSLEDPEYSFEAGWSPHGAVCVARTRWPDLQTRDQLSKDCPRLATSAPCDEASARRAGALLFDRSRTVPRVGD